MRSLGFGAAALVALSLAFPAMAGGDDGDGGRPKKKKEKKDKLSIDVKGDKVRVRTRDSHGREVTRELSTEEFFERFFGSRLHRTQDDGDDKDIFDEIEETLRTIPDRIERALGELRREAPERARELEQKARESIEDLLDSIRNRRGDMVHVRVGDREMDVPATVKNGRAKLY